MINISQVRFISIQTASCLIMVCFNTLIIKMPNHGMQSIILVKFCMFPVLNCFMLIDLLVTFEKYFSNKLFWSDIRSFKSFKGKLALLAFAINLSVIIK